MKGSTIQKTRNPGKKNDAFFPFDNRKVMCRVLRDDIKDRGLTVADLTAKLGVAENSVRHYLSVRATDAFIQKYCEAYGIPLKELIEKYENALIDRSNNLGACFQETIEKYGNNSLSVFCEKLGYSASKIDRIIRGEGTVNAKLLENVGSKFGADTWVLYFTAFNEGKLEPKAESLKEYLYVQSDNHLVAYSDSFMGLMTSLSEYKYLCSDSPADKKVDRKVLTINLIMFMFLYMEYMEGNTAIYRDLIYYAKHIEADHDLADDFKEGIKGISKPTIELANDYRKKMDYSIDDITEMMGISKMYVSNILKEKAPIYPKLSLKLYYACGLPPVIGLRKNLKEILAEKSSGKIGLRDFTGMCKSSMLWKSRGKLVNYEFIDNVLKNIFYTNNKLPILAETPVFIEDLSGDTGK